MSAEPVQTRAASANERSLRETSRLDWLDQLRALTGAAMFIVGAIAAFVLFRPLVPPRPLTIWLAVALIWHIAWALSLIAMLVMSPNPARVRAFWWKLGLIFGAGSLLITIWSIWLLLPYGTDVLRMVMVVFFVACVSVATSVGNPEVHLDRFATIGVLGSLAAWFLLSGASYGPILAIFLLAFGATSINIAATLRRGVAETVAARAESEKVSQGLSDALHKLAAERDAKTRFLASAWHDLGQPVQAARLFSEQAIRSPSSTEREKAVRGVNSAFDAVERLLQQILEHLRLDSQEVVAANETVPLAPLFAHISEANEPAAFVARTNLRTLTSRHAVKGDPVLIERILGNLIANAIRHADAKRVVMGARRMGDLIGIWVIDDGCGIPGEDRATLLDEFVQGSNHKDEIRGGFGLGLSSARRMARLMEGDIRHDPRWTKGAAFCLDLPLVEEPA